MLTTREVHLSTPSAFFFADDASQHHYENIDVDSFGRCASELITSTILGSVHCTQFFSALILFPSLDIETLAQRVAIFVPRSLAIDTPLSIIICTIDCFA